MKPIEEVYPFTASQFAECSYHTEGDYHPMLHSFGFEVLLQVDDDDYQGDSRVLYRDGGRYGHLNFGWGSCSGCDSLQACRSIEEIDQLRLGLHGSIKWFGSAAEALQWFTEHDWEGDYGWREDKQKEFIERAKAILQEVVDA